MPDDVNSEPEAEPEPDRPATPESGEPLREAEPSPAAESGPRRILSLIGKVLLSIPIAAAFAAVIAVGAYLAFTTGSFLAAGIVAFGSTADALFLIGAGLICGSAGILVIWTSVWACVTIIAGMFRRPAIETDEEDEIYD